MGCCRGIQLQAICGAWEAVGMEKNLPLNVFWPLIDVKVHEWVCGCMCECVCLCVWPERTVPGYCTLILGFQRIIPVDSLL